VAPVRLIDDDQFSAPIQGAQKETDDISERSVASCSHYLACRADLASCLPACGIIRRMIIGQTAVKLTLHSFDGSLQV
jgi:hypothetical protein